MQARRFRSAGSIEAADQTDHYTTAQRQFMERKMAKKKPNYQLLEKRIQDEIKALMKEIRSQVQWLDQHCKESIYHADTDILFDLYQLVELKEQMEKTTEDLQMQTGLIADSWSYGLYLLDEDPDYPEYMRTRIEELANQHTESEIPSNMYGDMNSRAKNALHELIRGIDENKLHAQTIDSLRIACENVLYEPQSGWGLQAIPSDIWDDLLKINDETEIGIDEIIEDGIRAHFWSEGLEEYLEDDENE
jgi:hypothetical protein